MTWFVNRRPYSHGAVETIDEFDTRHEAEDMADEYNLSDTTAHHYATTKPTKCWDTEGLIPVEADSFEISPGQHKEVRMLTSFYEGQRVTYVPAHAEGDPTHPDCEHGEITAFSDEENVWVHYEGRHYGQLTRLEDLRWRV